MTDYDACKRFCPETFSDLHKDAYGSRPRFAIEHLTPEQLDMLWDATLEALDRAIEEDRLSHLAGQRRFEDAIAKTMQAGSKKRGTAIAWLAEAEDCIEGLSFDEIDQADPQVELGYLLYRYGVSPLLAPMYAHELKEAGYRTPNLFL